MTTAAGTKECKCGCDLSQGEIAPAVPVVISGISGKFPESENLEEFWKNLYNGVDMVTDDGRRWTPGTLDLPKRLGKLKELDKFDAGFFGVHPKQADFMDPQLRILMEVTYEAIVDAGVNPAEMRRTRTGVFIGSSGSESEKEWLKKDSEDRRHGYALTGCHRGMLSNRISFSFDFHGPSFTVDTACSSSFIALEQALTSIKAGHCDAAIVGGTHLCLEPEMSLQFNRLNMLSPEGKCKSFDADGNGYVRSEAVVAIFIQKKDVARRSYASILAARTNTDGFKEKGVTFPSGERQRELLLETYKEAGVNPKDVVYVEAHGTGTPAGDPQELNAIAEVLCENRDEHNPLLIGSVKSNMGHSEPSAGLCGLVKVLLAFQNGVIPANLHFKNPNPGIAPLMDGRLKVVSQNTPWEGGIVGINSFGFGGANVHVILKSESEPQKQNSKITEDGNFLPFIIPFSGQSKESVEFSLKQIQGALKEKINANKPETSAATAALIYKIFQERIQKHPFCGFSLLHGNGQIQHQNSVEIKEISEKKPPVWFIFNGMGSQCLGFTQELFKFSAFKESIQKSIETLKNNKFDLKTVLFSSDEKILDDVTNSFVIITAVQIALVDLLSSLGIHPDGIVGHSVGELGAAYADGCLTLKQTILAALARGQAISERQSETSSDQKYGMAAVGQSWSEVKSKCPPNIYPACHNAKDSVTISGPLDDIQNFVDQLKKEGIFAKEVASSGRAFHSKYIEYAKPRLKILLDKIIPIGNSRTSRWKSTSIPESEWNSELAKTSSADYHVNNLISPVLFHEALEKVPESAVVIEIGPHCLLQSILKRSLPSCSHIGLLNKNQNSKDICSFLCQAIGKMYNCGLNPDFSRLYPSVEFPVPVSSSKVPSLSSLISMGWDHKKSWNVPNFDPVKNVKISAQNQFSKSRGQNSFEISLEIEDNKFYADHKINGRIIFPASGYLFLIWKAFSQLQNRLFEHVPVVFENFKIEQATVLPENENEGPVKFQVTILTSSGEFELVEEASEGSHVVVTGIVRSPKGNEFVSSLSLEKRGKTCEEEFTSILMNKNDVYKELRLRGNDSVGKFNGIFEFDPANRERNAKVEWLDNWVTFLDSIVQFANLCDFSRASVFPTYFEKVVIEPQNLLEKNSDESNKIPVFHDKVLSVVSSCGVEFQGLKFGSAPVPVPVEKRGKKVSGTLQLERFHFTPYFDNPEPSHTNCTGENKEEKDVGSETLMHFKRDNNLRTCIEIILENIGINTLKMVEICHSKKDLLLKSSMAQSIQSQVMKQPSKLFSGKIFLTQSPGENSGDYDLKSLKDAGISISIMTAENGKDRWKQLEDKTAQADLIALRNFNGLVKNEKANLILSSLKIQNFLLIENEKNYESLNTSVQEIEKIFGVVLVAQKLSFFLFRKRFLCPNTKNTVIEIDVTPSKIEDDFNYNWVEAIKTAMKQQTESRKEDERRVYVVSRNTPECPSGALGLINCLTKEPGGESIRCFFIQSNSDLKLDFENPDEFLAARLQQDLLFNIFDSNSDSNSYVWGSYRFLPLQPEGQQIVKKVGHCFLNIRTKGDLSSFQWLESPMKHHELQSDLCKVFYAAQGLHESLLGVEFSGKTSTGNKIMGYLPKAPAIATSVAPDPGFSWDVPGSWTLADAATVPLAYSTAFYALLLRGKMKEGESILILSGADGVGQAAISIALSMNCKVFTTVSSTEEREFLQKKFPQLNNSCFADSRASSFSFLNHILEQTGGKGVDLILNTLEGESLQPSLKYLRQHGRFLQIGKVDLFNSKFGMSVLLREVIFHRIRLDSVLSGSEQQKELWSLMDNGIKSGVVQPLPFTTFSDSPEEIEKAFRFMASENPMDKVLTKIRDENKESSLKTVEALPRSYFDPSKSYIVVGGLGGFGLEFSSWLVERGVKKLALVSRTGVKSGYQDYQIRKWREINKVSVFLSTIDITTTDGATTLIQTVISHFKTPLGGIFNLAMVMRHGLMEKQTVENFQAVSKPKVNAGLSLDKASRELAPSLEYFVVFSSIASGQGEMGVSNYAWANSASERICEQRRKAGFPALAIMWGAIGDVGVLQDLYKMGNDSVAAGTVPQRIFSCLEVLDVLLHESKRPNSEILVSRVIAENTAKLKSGAETKTSTTSKEEELNLSHKVAHILGMKPEELKNLNLKTKLVETGMDSLMQVEVKQLFEMYAGISFTLVEIGQLTFGKILEIQKKIDIEREASRFQVHDSNNFTLEKESEKLLCKLETGAVKAQTTLDRKEESNYLKKRQENGKSNGSCQKSTTASNSMNDCKSLCTRAELTQKLEAAASYFLAAFTVIGALILLLVSIFLRGFNQLYLKLFEDSGRIKIMTRPCDQFCASNPRTSNQMQCIKFSGTPIYEKILEKLEKNTVNWTTNILLENGAIKSCPQDSYYKPYESLRWKITNGILFDYWEKTEDFSMSNHLKFKTCAFISESELRKQALRLCEYYHNKKWDESKPQWEVCILAPKYESNYLTESREFYMLFVSCHSYGDGFSFLNMIQYALRDSKETNDKEQRMPEPRNQTSNLKVTSTAPSTEKERKSSSFEFDVSYHQKLSLSFEFLKDYAARLHSLISETMRIDAICRENNNKKFPSKLEDFDSSRYCELRKFDLSALKSVKTPVTGKRASVNAVILTCVAKAYKRIYKNNDNENVNNNDNETVKNTCRNYVKLPENLVSMMPFATFDHTQKRLDMQNNFSLSYTAVPTNIPNLHEQSLLNMIQTSIEDSSIQNKLRTSSDITFVLSSIAKPITRILIPFLSSPSFVFTTVPATFPKSATYFGGHQIKEFFAYTMLVSRTHGALASCIDSVNDSVNLSYVVDSSALENCPDFLELFFKYFQEELDDLILAT